MKTRFNTYDIVCMVTELQPLIGMRVNQVYDIDNRTYLIRVQRSEEKAVLLLDSGNRFHTTQFEWPKNVAPSGFTMKLRKHLKNKRLEKLTQLGIDRIVAMQFGSGEAAYHVILELYDRGNIVLTDYEWTILNVLRPHVEGDKFRFAVKEKYPLDRAKSWCEPPIGDALREILSRSKPGDNLKKILNPNVEYGPAIIDHVLLEVGLSGNMKVGKPNDQGFQLERDLDKLETALKLAEKMLQDARSNVAKGYIIQKKEDRPNPDGGQNFILTNVEFHPALFNQHKDSSLVEYESFDRAVDEFFSALEGQKIDLKTIQVEREAMKKLSNVRKDHATRLTELERLQQVDRDQAELITRNQDLVEQARRAVQAALASQMSWDDIKLLVKTAQENADPIASCIKNLRLDINHITLHLTDPYDTPGSDDEDEETRGLKPMDVDIDLSLTAFANARRYYDQKRSAAKKQQKTLESQDKALKSAERKTKQTLKEAQTISSISKARKTYWFEKFYWFISSDNILVIAGRDMQQNELLVKRYLRGHDVYVHADVTGAASVVVKCARGPPPPRTLHEAAHAAVAYSVAWEAKVLTSAWWVRASQVSKSAPTGEYLTAGSFMIRGKKNPLLPAQLQLGFGFMFRLEDSCIDRHRDDRKPLQLEGTGDVTGGDVKGDDDTSNDVTGDDVGEDDVEIAVSDDDGDDEPSEKESPKISEKEILTTIQEETKRAVQEESEMEKQDDGREKETENASSGSGSESDDDDLLDTHIKVDHGTGQVKIESKTRTISEVSDPSEEKQLSFPTLPKKGGKKPTKQAKVKETKPPIQKDGLKRGQRGKLKKIKEKYKDQDDEERALRTLVLQSANTAKESKKALKKNAMGGGRPSGKNRPPKIPMPAPQIYEADSEDDDKDTTEPQEVENADEQTSLLLQLCGAPLPEDELLFAVPVVAPYSTLQHYKFKVKLTPGTSKRGKAAKTAIQVFLKDPNCTQREKDLLKAVKEEDIARNFPGKVRLSAPNLHKRKK